VGEEEEEEREEEEGEEEEAEEVSSCFRPWSRTRLMAFGRRGRGERKEGRREGGKDGWVCFSSYDTKHKYYYCRPPSFPPSLPPYLGNPLHHRPVLPLDSPS
jgi:hypothetical protein